MVILLIVVLINSHSYIYIYMVIHGFIDGYINPIMGVINGYSE